MRGGIRIIIALVVALFGAVTYFSSSSTNEVTGEVQRISISPQQEIALGLQAAPEMMAQFGGEVDPNHPTSRYVEEVGQRVVRQSAAGKGPYQYDFHLLTDPETVNAFALPGGQISITVGLLKRLTNEAELAGVLGHEVGHVAGRHSAEQLAKQQFAQTMVGAVGVASFDPNNPRSTAQNAAIAAAVSQMVNMKFGREDELEADALGVRLMKESGYDPRGMTALMQVLAQGEGGGGRRPEFFSTHPNPENRIARINDMIAREGGAAGGETNEARFRENVLQYIKR